MKPKFISSESSLHTTEIDAIRSLKLATNNVVQQLWNSGRDNDDSYSLPLPKYFKDPVKELYEAKEKERALYTLRDNQKDVLSPKLESKEIQKLIRRKSTPQANTSVHFITNPVDPEMEENEFKSAIHTKNVIFSKDLF